MTTHTGRPESHPVAPGWYPDPARRFDVRYHNGRAWTADVATDGRRFVDPLGSTPAPTAHPAPASATGGPPAVASHPSDPAPSRNRIAVASMVLGIIAAATGWLPLLVVIGFVTGVLALVFGMIGLRRAATSGVGRAFAVTGVVTGAVGLLACVIGVLLTIVVYDAVDRYEHPEPNEAVITSCELDGSNASMTGRITNLGSSTADFSVRLAFVRPGTNNPHRSARVAIDDVPPNASQTFDVERSVDLDDVGCIVVGVDGPLPFGLALD